MNESSSPSAPRPVSDYTRATPALAKAWHPTTVLCDRCGRDWGSEYTLMHRADATVAVCLGCAEAIDMQADDPPEVARGAFPAGPDAPQERTVPVSVYESAVKGRQEFRRALVEARNAKRDEVLASLTDVELAALGLRVMVSTSTEPPTSEETVQPSMSDIRVWIAALPSDAIAQVVSAHREAWDAATRSISDGRVLIVLDAAAQAFRDSLILLAARAPAGPLTEWKWVQRARAVLEDLQGDVMRAQAFGAAQRCGHIMHQEGYNWCAECRGNEITSLLGEALARVPAGRDSLVTPPEQSSAGASHGLGADVGLGG